MERYSTPSGVVLMLKREFEGRTQILLQRRQNTGFADGLFDLSCSGHVEKNEAMSDTVLRECREELGLELKKEEISFFCFVHKRDKDVVYNYTYFYCDNFLGEPKIMEPEKCSELKWVDIDKLPGDVIDDRVQVIKAYKNGVHYLEYGW